MTHGDDGNIYVSLTL